MPSAVTKEAVDFFVFFKFQIMLMREASTEQKTFANADRSTTLISITHSKSFIMSIIIFKS